MEKLYLTLYEMNILKAKHSKFKDYYKKVFNLCRIAETTIELYQFIINNIETVDRFNEEMSLYLQGKMPFQEQQYMNIML